MVPKTVLVFSVLVAGALSGCATTGSVDALDPRLKEITGKIDKLERDVKAAGDMIKNANQLSETALKTAENALKMTEKVSSKLKP